MEYKTTIDNLLLFREPVEMPGGWSFDHVSTLQRIELYWNDQFESGKYDENGFYKYFYNIVKPASEVARKFIELDTRNILLFSMSYDDTMRVWLMQRQLHVWLKENKFGVLLNEMLDDYVKYGHVVIKRTQLGKWHKVNIMNLRLDPSAQTLQESSFIYELHTKSLKQMKALKWDTEELEQRYPNDTSFVVYECYEANAEGYTRTIKAGLFCKETYQNKGTEAEINERDEYLPPIILKEDEVKELPYRETKWEDCPGRWLGRGVVEYLFDNQIRINELTNTKARGLQLAGLTIFQTQDELAPRNIFTDVENGQIFQSSGISPIATEMRGLGQYSAEEQRWDMNTDRKTFAYDIARGEDLPSGTPLGVAKIQAGQVENYFQLKREKFGLFLKALFTDDIIPAFKKENSKEHILRLMGSEKEIERLRQTIIQQQTRKQVFAYAMKTGIIPSPMAIKLEQTRLMLQSRKEKDIEVKIPDGFWDGVKTLVDITITGEEVDLPARNQSLMNVMQMLAPNPQLLENPVIRTLVTKMLENAGLSAVDLDLIQASMDEASQMQQPQQQGGRVAQGQEPPSATSNQASIEATEANVA